LQRAIEGVSVGTSIASSIFHEACRFIAFSQGKGREVKLRKQVLSVAAACLFLGTYTAAQDQAAPVQWEAPSTWEAASIPTAPLQFVAIAPCRILDTRGNGFSGQWGPPRLGAGGVRSFVITGRCGIPAEAQAVSANLGVSETEGAGFVLTYPQGGPVPAVSAVNYERAGQTIANASVLALGDGGGITVTAGVASTQFFVDVNGYYASNGAVTSLNALSGALTLEAGANVTLAPSGNSITISSEGAQGPTGGQGIQGPAGPGGAPGPQGTPGGQGAPGAQGPMGSQGIQGPLGPAAGSLLGANLPNLTALGGPQYIAVFGQSVSASELVTAVKVASGTAKKLFFEVDALPAGATATLTIMQNGAPTLLACTVTNGPPVLFTANGTVNTFECANTANAIPFFDGAALSARYTVTGADGGRVRFSFVYVAEELFNP
jgi:hypothetical protein